MMTLRTIKIVHLNRKPKAKSELETKIKIQIWLIKRKSKSDIQIENEFSNRILDNHPRSHFQILETTPTQN